MRSESEWRIPAMPAADYKDAVDARFSARDIIRLSEKEAKQNKRFGWGKRQRSTAVLLRIKK